MSLNNEMTHRRRRRAPSSSSRRSTNIGIVGRGSWPLVFILTLLSCVYYNYSPAASQSLSNSPVNSPDGGPNGRRSPNTANGDDAERPHNFLRWRATQEETKTKTNEDFLNTTLANDFSSTSGTYVEFSSFGLQIGPAVGLLNIDEIGGAMEALKYAVESHLNSTLRNVDLVSLGYASGSFDFVQVDDIILFVQAVKGGENTKEGGESIRGLQQQQQATGSSINVMVTGGRAYYLYGNGGLFMTSIPTSNDLDTIVIESVEQKAADGGNDNVGGVLAGQIRGLPNNYLGGDVLDGDSNFGSDLSLFQGVESVQVVDGLTLFTPTSLPTAEPTTAEPSYSPITPEPSYNPTYSPTTAQPTKLPTPAPTTPAPSKQITPEPTPKLVPDEVLSTPLPSALMAPAPSTSNPSPIFPSEQTSTEATQLATEAAQITATVSAQSATTSSTTTTTDISETTIFVGGRPSGGDMLDQTFVNNPDSGNSSEDGSNGEDGDGSDANDPTISQSKQGGDSVNSNETDGGNSNTQNIILASTIMALVVVAAAVAFFIYRKKQRDNSDDESNARSDGEMVKGVPLSRLTDEEDDFGSDGLAGSAAYNGLYGMAGNHNGGSVDNSGNESATALRDNTTSHRSILRDTGSEQNVLQRDVESQQMNDENYDKMVAKAMIIGAATAVAGGAASNRNGEAGELQRHQDLDEGLIPQFDEATRQSRIQNLGLDDTDVYVALPRNPTQTTVDDPVGNIASYDTMESGYEGTSKEQPLGCHDSLNMKYPMSSTIQSRDISDLDLLVAGLGNTDDGCADDNAAFKDLVYDDIEEAMKLAVSANTGSTNGEDSALAEIDAMYLAALASSNKKQRGSDTKLLQEDEEEGFASFQENFIVEPIISCQEESFASHDILNDINQLAALERQRSLGAAKSQQQPNEFDLSHNNTINNARGYNENGITESPKESMMPDYEEDPEDDEVYSHDILDTISEVARSTRSNTPTTLKADTYIPVSKLGGVLQDATTRSNVVSPSSSIPASIRDDPLSTNPSRTEDPPGSVSCVSNNDDDTIDLFAELRTVETDVFADLQAGVNGRDSSRPVSPFAATGVIKEKMKKWNPFGSSPRASPVNTPPHEYSSGVNPDTTTIVSDDEDEQNDDIARPWKEKWDPFANNQTDALRPVSPAMKAATDLDGSNFDPDSDWDVDDTEVDFGMNEDIMFETAVSPCANNKDVDDAVMRIW